MDERAQRFRAIIEGSGKTYRELEEITGVKKSSLQRYASGNTTKIPLDVIDKLEKSFNLPRGYIMGWADKPAEELQGLGALAAEVLLQPDTMEMVQNYLSLSEADQQTVRTLVASMAEKSKKA